MIPSEGPLLTIDLDEEETETTDISDVHESFIGGRGVCTKLAYDRVPHDVDPFSPRNRVYFATGPMQQSTMSFTGRMNATSVSPLTDGLLSTNAGGFMSRNFAATGYGAVEIVGDSSDLVIVHVTDDGVEFEAVPELEDALVSEVTEHVEESRGIGAEHIAAIGPAGENQVRYASIMTTESRAFGRGGLGAVLGSKNVKAITFDGDSAPDIDIPDIQMEVHRDAATSDHIMKRQGTTSVAEYANTVGALPSYYFAETQFDGIEDIKGDRVEEKKYKKGSCSACAFACKLPTRDEESGVETEGPEYETLMAFGSNSGVDDVISIMQSNELCDELGLDTISCGDSVAAYLAANDEFGNSELIHDLVEKIAYREGEGDLLAEGVHRIHDDLGVEDWTVKGMEFSAHDGRHLNGQGLAFATSNRGADHMYAEFYSIEYPLVAKDKAMDPSGLEGKPPRIVQKENHNAVLDSGVVCKFSRDFIDEDRLGTLLDAEYDDLLEIGGRVVNLERRFNNDRGRDRSDDTLPYDLPDFENALSEYYEIRGWDENGVVPEDHSAVSAD